MSEWEVVRMDFKRFEYHHVHQIPQQNFPSFASESQLSACNAFTNIYIFILYIYLCIIIYIILYILLFQPRLKNE